MSINLSPRRYMKGVDLNSKYVCKFRSLVKERCWFLYTKDGNSLRFNSWYELILEAIFIETKSCEGLVDRYIQYSKSEGFSFTGSEAIYSDRVSAKRSLLRVIGLTGLLTLSCGKATRKHKLPKDTIIDNSFFLVQGPKGIYHLYHVDYVDSICTGEKNELQEISILLKWAFAYESDRPVKRIKIFGQNDWHTYVDIPITKGPKLKTKTKKLKTKTKKLKPKVKLKYILYDDPLYVALLADILAIEQPFMCICKAAKVDTSLIHKMNKNGPISSQQYLKLRNWCDSIKNKDKMKDITYAEQLGGYKEYAQMYKDIKATGIPSTVICLEARVSINVFYDMSKKRTISFNAKNKLSKWLHTFNFVTEHGLSVDEFEKIRKKYNLPDLSYDKLCARLKNDRSLIYRLKRGMSVQKNKIMWCSDVTRAKPMVRKKVIKVESSQYSSFLEDISNLSVSVKNICKLAHVSSDTISRMRAGLSISAGQYSKLIDWYTKLKLEESKNKITKVDVVKKLMSKPESQGTTDMSLNKPPLGIMPKGIWEEQRMWDLMECILRNKDSVISTEWLTEFKEKYNKFYDNIMNRVEKQL